MAGEYNSLNLQVGDTVRVRHYTCVTLYGDTVDGYNVGKTAIVLRLFRDYSWRGSDNMASLRILEEGRAWVTSHELSKLDLLVKGNGTFELGVTHAFSEHELQERRRIAYETALANANRQHQGYCNAATFLAWLYLANDSGCVEQLRRMRRKDGTINEHKVQKLFRDQRLEIDDWALEPFIEPPKEFAHLTHLFCKREQVRWLEVAEQFAVTADSLVNDQGAETRARQ